MSLKKADAIHFTTNSHFMKQEKDQSFYQPTTFIGWVLYVVAVLCVMTVFMTILGGLFYLIEKK